MSSNRNYLSPADSLFVRLLFRHLRACPLANFCLANFSQRSVESSGRLRLPTSALCFHLTLDPSNPRTLEPCLSAIALLTSALLTSRSVSVESPEATALPNFRSSGLPRCCVMVLWTVELVSLLACENTGCVPH